MNNNKDCIVIRKICNSDIDQLLDLLNTLSEASKRFFHPHDFNKKTLNQIIKNTTDHYFVMLFENKIIGYSFLRCFGFKIPSYGCCIHQNYQKKGYATILTYWTLQKAQSLGYKKIILNVYKKNMPAIQLYKKVGFTINTDSNDIETIGMEYHC
jgi:RimJ/RimL family protein N-acetyltransferase